MNLPLRAHPSSQDEMKFSDLGSGQSGITGLMPIDHVPQKMKTAAVAKTAVKAINHNCPDLRRIYATLPSAISVNTMTKIETVSTMPSAMI